MEEEILIPQYFYDGQLDQSQITPALLDEIDMLAPFGFGNPNPKFLLPSAVVKPTDLWEGIRTFETGLVIWKAFMGCNRVRYGRGGKNLHQGSRVSLLTSLSEASG